MVKKSETRLKTIMIVLAILFFARVCSAEIYTFTFYDKQTQVMKLVMESFSDKEAMQKAGRLCFDVLSKGKYQGEEKGMEIIDICANPKMKKK